MHTEPIIPMKFVAGASSLLLAVLGETNSTVMQSPVLFTAHEVGVSLLAGMFGAWAFRKEAGFLVDRDAIAAIAIGAVFAAIGGPFWAHWLANKLDWLAPGQILTDAVTGLTIGLLSTWILALARNPFTIAEAAIKLWNLFNRK